MNPFQFVPTDPAFPTEAPRQDTTLRGSPGMDLRTYAAVSVAQGLLSNPIFLQSFYAEAEKVGAAKAYEGLAKAATLGADALLAKLQNP